MALEQERGISITAAALGPSALVWAASETLERFVASSKAIRADGVD